MALKNLYAVRDAKTEAYFPPFVAVTHGEAYRQFQMLATNPETLLSKFPADYALFQLGTFDDQSGVIGALPQPLQLATALEYSKEAIHRANEELQRNVKISV